MCEPKPLKPQSFNSAIKFQEQTFFLFFLCFHEVTEKKTNEMHAL